MNWESEERKCGFNYINNGKPSVSTIPDSVRFLHFAICFHTNQASPCKNNNCVVLQHVLGSIWVRCFLLLCLCDRTYYIALQVQRLCHSTGPIFSRPHWTIYMFACNSKTLRTIMSDYLAWIHNLAVRTIMKTYQVKCKSWAENFGFVSVTSQAKCSLKRHATN